MLSHERRCRTADAREILRGLEKLLCNPDALAEADNVQETLLVLGMQIEALRILPEPHAPVQDQLVVVGSNVDNAQVAYFPERDAWEPSAVLSTATVVLGEHQLHASCGQGDIASRIFIRVHQRLYRDNDNHETKYAEEVAWDLLPRDKKDQWRAVTCRQFAENGSRLVALAEDGTLEQYQLPELTKLAPLPQCPFRRNVERRNELMLLSDNTLFWLHAEEQCAALVDGVWGPVASLPLRFHRHSYSYVTARKFVFLADAEFLK